METISTVGKICAEVGILLVFSDITAFLMFFIFFFFNDLEAVLAEKMGIFLLYRRRLHCRTPIETIGLRSI